MKVLVKILLLTLIFGVVFLYKHWFGFENTVLFVLVMIYWAIPLQKR